VDLRNSDALSGKVEWSHHRCVYMKLAQPKPVIRCSHADFANFWQFVAVAASLCS
jgi:hypothetical protein